MFFPLSNVTLSPVVLATLGFFIGILGGFFGVGGSFIAGPALLFLGVPAHFVVGTDTAHITGKSIVAAKKHRALGNVDIKLGLLMTIGTTTGVETGARIVDALQRAGSAEIVLRWLFVIILTCISIFVTWESLRTMRKMRTEGNVSGQDQMSFTSLAHWIHGIHLPPVVSLPTSGIAQISIWAIIVVGYFSGVLSGLLGGGAGYVRLPSLIYMLGVPTHIAIGTDLFEVIISAGYGTITHALKGNVDVMMALVMHTGAAIGAQIGVASTRFVGGPKLRLAFALMPLIGAALILFQILTGRGAG